MPKLEVATDFEHIPVVRPSKNYIPDWYAKTPMFLGQKMEFTKWGMNPALRACVPFMDAFLTGYTVELWTDLIVEQGVHGSIIRWPGQSAEVGPDMWEPLAVRGPEVTHPMPAPNGYENRHYAWHNPHLIKTPPGYSILVTQPLNQYDTPFFTMSAVIDCDKDLLSSGRIPFYVKEGFEGLVPKGTPLYQIIPIKREKWEAVENPSLRKDNRRRIWQVGSVLTGWYRNNLWVKKEYH